MDSARLDAAIAGALQLLGRTVKRDEPAPPAQVNAPERPVRLLKAEAQEERYVFGIVLIPDTTDSQGDVYNAAEVRKAAYGFMEHYAGRIGLMHRGFLDGRAKVLETYVSKQVENHGDEEFPAGTWFLGIRVDEELWADVKAGKLTGFSIGGTALREAVT